MSGKDTLKLGATFYPGGQDDFYMPELISPSPQRVMPEVPTNMQKGIAHLELEAKDARPREDSLVSMVSPTEQYNNYASLPLPTARPDTRSVTATPGPAGFSASYAHTNASAYQNLYKSAGPSQPEYRSYATAKAAEAAQPSPFPKLRNAGPNVPPSDEEKEQVLERARPLVLNSNDPEMQLAWAQDALLWVDTSQSNRARLADEQNGRPSTPHVEHQLMVDSTSIVNFLAGQGHPKALFLQAFWDEFGKFGRPLDRAKAFLGYRKAAEKGYARAEYRIGTQYEGMHDMTKAIKHYNKGVEMKDSASHYRMGMMSLLGQNGIQPDYNLGIQRIQFAAETADESAAQGAYVYGMLLARELPNIAVPESILPVDIEKARTYVEKAAYLGFAKAQLKMGSAYELCLLGCEFSPALSLHYNSLAARQGDAEADMAISKWFLCGYEGVFERNEELAFKYARRAAQLDLPTAEFAMGYFYEVGIRVAVDLRQAQDWYQKASDHGNHDAEGRLEALKMHQTLSKKDHEQIAISRIKSQYGSRRGERPERLRDRKPLPSVNEVPPPPPSNAVDMPNPGAQLRASGVSTPFMVVPPADDHRPVGSQHTYPPTRPKSTAPYPDDDDVGLRPYNSEPQFRPLTGPQADRPNSAFGIRPLRIPQQNQDPDRPFTSVPEGRGSNPSGRHLVVSAGWEPQDQRGYRQPSAGPSRGAHGRKSSLETSPNRNRLQKPPPSLPVSQDGPGYPVTPMMNAAQPVQASPYGTLPSQQPGFARGGNPNPAYDRPASNAYSNNQDERRTSYSRESRPNAVPAGQQHSSYSGPETINPYTNRRVESADHRPQNSDYQAQQRPDASQYGVPISQQSRPMRTSPNAQPNNSGPAVPPLRLSPAAQTGTKPPPAGPTAPAATTGGPPKKEGPKTFEDMGIPHGKTDGDCIIM